MLYIATIFAACFVCVQRRILQDRRKKRSSKTSEVGAQTSEVWGCGEFVMLCVPMSLQGLHFIVTLFLVQVHAWSSLHAMLSHVHSAGYDWS